MQNPDILTILFRRKMISESAGERLPAINLQNCRNHYFNYP